MHLAKIATALIIGSGSNEASERLLARSEVEPDRRSRLFLCAHRLGAAKAANRYNFNALPVFVNGVAR